MQKTWYSLAIVLCMLMAGVSWYGCTVSYTLSGAKIPDAAKTVSIDFFENVAPLASPTTAQIVTEALRDKFQRESRLRLVSSSGDLAFRGSITGYTTAPVAITGNETAAFTRLTITISVNYESKLEEDKNFEQTFTRFADFNSSQSLSSVEEALIREITAQLVQDVFNRAFLDW